MFKLKIKSDIGQHSQFLRCFGENIHIEKFQPYEKVFGCAGMILPTHSQPRQHYCLTDGAAVDQVVFLLLMIEGNRNKKEKGFIHRPTTK